MGATSLCNEQNLESRMLVHRQGYWQKSHSGLSCCGAFLDCLFVLAAVGPLAVNAAVFDEETRRAILQHDGACVVGCARADVAVCANVRSYWRRGLIVCSVHECHCCKSCNETCQLNVLLYSNFNVLWCTLKTAKRLRRSGNKTSLFLSTRYR